MRIKCFRFECSQCGEISSTQVFYRKDGSAGYARARYKNAQGFFYHEQSTDYVIEKLGKLSSLDQGQHSIGISIDPNLLNLSSNCKLMAGGEGFEPSTPNLGGWCSIREDVKTLQEPPCRDTFNPC